MASKSRKSVAAQQDEWSERIDTMKEGLVEFDEEMREAVREHPVACLCGALALGYLVGRLVART